MMAAVPYIHNVGKQVQKLQNSTLMDRNRWKWYTVQKNIGGATMNIKLTLGERLKDLRVERNLKLETLAEQTGLSKSALSKYESDDVTDLSIYAVTTLAEFYGVTTDYLLGLSESEARIWKAHSVSKAPALRLGAQHINYIPRRRKAAQIPDFPAGE